MVDVAGGRGDLAAALLRRGAAVQATVVEPVARAPYRDRAEIQLAGPGTPRRGRDPPPTAARRRRVRYVLLRLRAARAERADAARIIENGDRRRDAAHGDDSDDAAVDDASARAVRRVAATFDHPPAPAVAALLCDATAVVALHPDEATEAAVCAAAARGLPFAVVPCCIFASHFPARRQFWRFDPESRKNGIRTADSFLEYLKRRAIALGAGDVRVASLALVGKNTVLYSLGGAAAPRPAWPGEAIRAVVAFLEVDKVVLGDVRAVDREWRFHANLALRYDRLDDAAAAAGAAGARVRRGVPGDVSGRRLANAAETMAALSTIPLPRRAKRVIAAVHGVVLGPAFLGEREMFVERAGLVVGWGDVL